MRYCKQLNNLAVSKTINKLKLTGSVKSASENGGVRKTEARVDNLIERISRRLKDQKLK